MGDARSRMQQDATKRKWAEGAKVTSETLAFIVMAAEIDPEPTTKCILAIAAAVTGVVYLAYEWAEAKEVFESSEATTVDLPPVIKPEPPIPVDPNNPPDPATDPPGNPWDASWFGLPISDPENGGNGIPNGIYYSGEDSTDIGASGVQGGCFPAETLVATGTDSFAPISEIRPGQTVVSSMVIEDMAKGPGLVTRVHTKKHVESMVRITMDTHERLTTTPEQRFFVPGTGFVSARDLTLDTELLTCLGRRSAIKNIEATDGNIAVFNLSVAGVHTYFVGRTGILVHNDKNIGPDLWDLEGEGNANV